MSLLLYFIRCCLLQSDDGFLTQHTLSDADSSVRALPQAIHALEVSNEPQEFDELYLQHQADESQETSVVSEGDSTAARVMASAMSDQFSLMDGSLDSADWTALDQEAVGRSSAGDNLSWSIVVSSLALARHFHTVCCTSISSAVAMPVCGFLHHSRSSTLEALWHEALLALRTAVQCVMPCLQSFSWDLT